MGPARVSVQQMVGLVGPGQSVDEVRRQSKLRFGDHSANGLVCGDAEQLVAYFTELARDGVERFYVWFTDFAPPATLTAFGKTVLAAVTNSPGTE